MHASLLRSRGTCDIPTVLRAYLLVQELISKYTLVATDEYADTRASECVCLKCMHACNQVIASIPGIELVQGKGEGHSHLSERAVSPILIPAKTIPRSSVDPSTAHTQLSSGEKGELGGTRRGKSATRRPLFDTFGRPVTHGEGRHRGAVEARDNAQDAATQLEAPPPLLIGVGTTKGGAGGGERQSSHVHVLKRANMGEFFKVWGSMNYKFVLLNAHEEIDMHWEGLAQSFAGQALFFQVVLFCVRFIRANGACACDVDS